MTTSTRTSRQASRAWRLAAVVAGIGVALGVATPAMATTTATTTESYANADTISGDAQGTVNWRLFAGTDGAVGVKVSRDGNVSAPLSSTKGTSGTVVFTGLTNERTYNVTVQPVNSAGTLLGQPFITPVTPHSANPPTTAPGVPTNVVAKVNSNRTVTITGTVAPGTSEVRFYETVHATSSKVQGTATVNGSTFTWTSPVKAPGSYKWQAQDANSYGTSARVATSPSTVTVR